jgi:hypothetical protein
MLYNESKHNILALVGMANKIGTHYGLIVVKMTPFEKILVNSSTMG